MEFYIYENWTHDRVRIHRASCGYCNNGDGTQASTSPKNGRWLGPFDNRALVFAKAKSLKRMDTKPCGTCNP